MAAAWHSHLAGKLALAQTLLRLAVNSNQPLQQQPQSIDQLGKLIGADASEVQQLLALQASADSWWNHLEQLGDAQNRPPAAKKTISNDNIIAITAAVGADRSLSSVQASLIAIKQFSADVEARHSEW
jgi:ABC-type Fe3+-hydroxamate transport system substrate-binding protein